MKSIIDLLAADGIAASHASRQEWHSPCPLCGGRDRFSTWPDKPNSSGRFMGGRFVCRGCGIHGDAVALLQLRRGLSFREACEALDVEPGPAPTGHRQPAAWQPEPPAAAPGAAWQGRARAFLSYTQRALASNQAAIDWLKAERGLTLETIRAAGLGWNPKDVFDSRESWGLPDETGKNGRTKKQWLPSGLIIPYFHGGQLHRIRIRRSEPGQGSRYIMVSGSARRAMSLWADQPGVAIVESELDAILMQQETGDIIGVIALGSAQMKPDAELHARLMAAKKLLCCLDTDDAGGKAAWGHWRKYPGFQRWPPVRGKDPCEMLKAGTSIKAWLHAGLYPSGGAGPS